MCERPVHFVILSLCVSQRVFKGTKFGLQLQQHASEDVESAVAPEWQYEDLFERHERVEPTDLEEQGMEFEDEFDRKLDKQSRGANQDEERKTSEQEEWEVLLSSSWPCPELCQLCGWALCPGLVLLLSSSWPRP